MQAEVRTPGSVGTPATGNSQLHQGKPRDDSSSRDARKIRKTSNIRASATSLTKASAETPTTAWTLEILRTS
jgi:hypothetical protein